MNYSSIYDKLIERAKGRALSENEYYEKHHIIPRCMDGKDEDDNLVNLTAREHYIAHLLLCKIYPNNLKLITAALMMCVDNTYRERRSNNRLYEWIRKGFSENHPSRTCEGKEKIRQGLAIWYRSTGWKERRREWRIIR